MSEHSEFESKGNGETDASIEQAWNDEVARRIREVEEGKVQCVPYEEVMASLQKLLREK